MQSRTQHVIRWLLRWFRRIKFDDDKRSFNFVYTVPLALDHNEYLLKGCHSVHQNRNILSNSSQNSRFKQIVPIYQAIYCPTLIE